MILKWKNKASFYASSAWAKVRDLILTRDPFCKKCLLKGIEKPSEEVHHKKPLELFPELALNEGNLEGLCKECHSAETQKESQNKKSGGILNHKWEIPLNK
jgi:5-methylcytosine-specific restriction enzyme A